MPLPVFVLLLSHILLWRAINSLSQRNFYIYFYHFCFLLCRCMFCLVWDPFWLKSFMNNFFSLGLLAVNSLSFFSSVKSLFYLHFQKIFFLCIEFWVDRIWGFFPFITLTVSLPCLVDCIVSDEKSLLIVMFLPLSIIYLLFLAACKVVSLSLVSAVWLRCVPVFTGFKCNFFLVVVRSELVQSCCCIHVGCSGGVSLGSAHHCQPNSNTGLGLEVAQIQFVLLSNTS